MASRVRIDHVGLWVQNTEKAVRFYKEVFGFAVKEQRLLGSGVQATGLSVGDSLIFLLEVSGKTPVESPKHTGVDHLCLLFDTEEFRAVQDRVEKLGVPVVEVLRERGGASGLGPSFYIEDTDHHRLEVKRF